MAVIAFLMDIEDGHNLATIGFADSLRSRGHKVVYVSIPDNREMLAPYGFEFFPVFEETYPEGFKSRFKKERSQESWDRKQERSHVVSILDGCLDRMFQEVKPDLVIVSSFLILEALLIHYHYGIYPVMYTPMLRHKDTSLFTECQKIIMDLPNQAVVSTMDFLDSKNIRYTTLQDVLKPISEFTELLCCPAEFEINAVPGPKRHYIEPAIRPATNESNDPVDLPLDNGKKWIYASLGSQAMRYRHIKEPFYKLMCDMMRHPSMQEYEMILTTGQENVDLPLVPSNITVVPWISLPSILNSLTLVINHGGIGTVKECILAGVPMIAMGVRHDQPYCAYLVGLHRLGADVELASATGDQLAEAAVNVLSDPEVGVAMKRMQKIFMEMEQSKPGVAVIENLLKEVQAQGTGGRKLPVRLDGVQMRHA